MIAKFNICALALLMMMLFHSSSAMFHHDPYSKDTPFKTIYQPAAIAVGASDTGEVYRLSHRTTTFQFVEWINGTSESSIALFRRCRNRKVRRTKVDICFGRGFGTKIRVLEKRTTLQNMKYAAESTRLGERQYLYQHTDIGPMVNIQVEDTESRLNEQVFWITAAAHVVPVAFDE